MNIKQCALHNASSSCMMWLHLGASFLIRWTKLNTDDLYSSVSSELLIEGEEANRTVTPKFSLFIPLFFDKKTILECFE